MSNSINPSLEARLDQILTIVADTRNMVETRLDRLEQRFDIIDQRLDKIELRLDKVEQRLDKVELRLDALEQRFDNLEQRFDNLEQSMEQRFDKIEGRLNIVEERLAPTNQFPKVFILIEDLSHKFDLFMHDFRELQRRQAHDSQHLIDIEVRLDKHGVRISNLEEKNH